MTVSEKRSLLSPDWYLFIVVSGNKYLPKGNNGNILCNHTIFGFSHDSLNSVKFI